MFIISPTFLLDSVANSVTTVSSTPRRSKQRNASCHHHDASDGDCRRRGHGGALICHRHQGDLHETFDMIILTKTVIFIDISYNRGYFKVYANK